MYDLIDRKMAIEALSELREKTVASESFRLGIYYAIEEIKNVSSAQPTQTNADSTQCNTLDCVSRQAAIDAICKACSLTADYHKCDGYPEGSTWCEELVALREIPSAHPRKKGKWIEIEPHMVICPFCKYASSRKNFCAECGADMRGESDE